MKIKKIFLVVAFFGFFTTSKAQTFTKAKQDSLMAIWNNKSQADTTRLNAVNQIAWDGFLNTKPDSAYYYAQLQYDLASETDNEESMFMALNTQGSYFLEQGKLDKALSIFNDEHKIAVSITNKKLIGIAITNTANAYQYKGEYEKSLEYYFQSLKLFEELKNKERIGQVLKQIGTIYYKQGNLDEALSNLFKSGKIFEEIQNLPEQANTHNIIGGIYVQQGDNEKALEILNRNVEIFKNTGDKLGVAGTLTNIGTIYKENGEYEKALENYKTALIGFEELNNSRGIAGVSSTIAGLYVIQKNYPLALEYLKRTLEISEKSGNKEGITVALNSMAEIYEAQENYLEAISIGTTALNLTQEMGNILRTNSLSDILAESYKGIGNYKKALEMTELFQVTKDSLNSKENQKAIIQMQVQADYEKQKAIDDIENEKAITIQAAKTKAQSKISLAIGAVLLLISLLTFVIFNRLKATRKQKAVIEKQKKKVEQSEKYKEQFLANMSHEIRTPMHAISGMTKILKRNAHPPAQDVYLNAMQTSSDNLVVILNDVLDLSKIEAGKLEIESIPMNPRLVIENVLQILKFKAEEKGLKLSYKAANNVPALVMGDSTRLNQILINLVGNAIKFTDKGTVDISLHLENEQLQFQVKDTGIGIPKDKQEHIFDAFEQAKNSTTRIYGGTGLGLSISQQLVELQNGKIWLESEEGAGSSFYIALPMTVAEADAVGADLISEEKLKTMAASLEGIRILLAEDNPFNQMIAQDDLSYYIKGITFDIADNGAIAVEKFKADAYDLILMDVQMPEMNGFEAAKKIRKIEKSEKRETNIPIIAMTASLMKTEIDSCFKAGMDNYIPKPYTIEELIGPIFKELRSQP